MFSVLRITRQITKKIINYSTKAPQPLRSKKPKSDRSTPQYFVDLKNIRAVGGKGGDGCISFLHLWANENAGPDGGDGGNGGHVILKASIDIKDLNYVTSIVKAENGERGFNKDCNGKNATHNIIKVPTGTIIKDKNGVVVGDLVTEGMMFVAARGGAGGKGNHYFITDTEQAPEICEYGATGEEIEYTLEIRSMAHVGLIGFPNAGKSTLLRAISRARPKVAPYPFTTLKPHLGMIQYDDYEQIAGTLIMYVSQFCPTPLGSKEPLADLPGLIPDSHKNRGLGIRFLKHAERCMALLYVLDMSDNEPWHHLEILQFELSQFSKELISRPQLIIANKMDLPKADENLKLMKENLDLPIVSVSAKFGSNLLELLTKIRELYDNHNLKT